MTQGVVEAVDPRDFVRPRMRGWLHLVAAPVSLVAGIVLIALAAGDRLAVSVYVASVAGLFATSATYHRVTWTPRARRLMQRLDHSMIFVLIAGTYTGFVAPTLPGSQATVLLSLIWTGALLGVVFRVAWPTAPRWLTAPVYVALGWTAIFVLPGLLAGGGVVALVLLLVGGGLYSVGAVAYATRWPALRPVTFGYHEVFHACTLVAAACHFIGIFFAVYH